MSLNAVTRLREQLLPDYLSIKKSTDFKAYIVLDYNHSSYHWNRQVCDSLGHSLLVAMTNDTFVKSSMVPQSDDQFLAIEATIEANKQESYNNHKKTDEKLTLITENQKETNEKLNETNEKLTVLLAAMKIDKNNISTSSPSQKYTSPPPEPTTTAQTNRRAPPLKRKNLR